MSTQVEDNFKYYRNIADNDQAAATLCLADIIYQMLSAMFMHQLAGKKQKGKINIYSDED